MTTEEKAKAYDELQAIVDAFYSDIDEEEPDETLGDLGNLGEKIAIYFGYL